MKWQRYFLILFLIPNFLFGLDQNYCNTLYTQICIEWTKHIDLIEEFKKQDVSNLEERLDLLKKSLSLCNSARASCDIIINDIDSKSKKEKKNWCLKLRFSCFDIKIKLEKEIFVLKPAVDELENQFSFKKADAIYQKALIKAAEAHNKDVPQTSLNNVDVVVAALNEISKLYEEAATFSKEALALVPEHYSYWESKRNLKKAVIDYETLSGKFKKEAIDWSASMESQKNNLKEKITLLKAESELFKEKGLKRSCYELQKQIVPILEQFIEYCKGEERENLKNELDQLKVAISIFEIESDHGRLTDKVEALSQEDFRSRERTRKEQFFKTNPRINQPESLKNTNDSNCPLVTPLDGYADKNEEAFTLYTEQFYRFLIHNNEVSPELTIQVFEGDQIKHVEQISLPFGKREKNSVPLENYIKNGMVFIPETKAEAEFGLKLRLSLSCDPENVFSLILSLKGTDPRYDFSISLDHGIEAFKCQFIIPPPWQLDVLRKPALVTPEQAIDQTPIPPFSVHFEGSGQLPLDLESMSYLPLEQLVRDLKQDALAIASFVQNEISFTDLYLHQENGIFYAPCILRNPCTTYLEKQGSPWEQCQLLLYLLRKAGYQAYYAIGDPISLPKAFIEKLLFTKIGDSESEALLKYPWVIFFDGKEWVSLFPWMKEIEIREGFDLYTLMPEEYASAGRWILDYLKGHEKIFKHIGPDGDDTAGILFIRFVKEMLRKKGLSLDDVGIHRKLHKKQFSLWQDFPHPSLPENVQVFNSLNGLPWLFATAKLDIYSKQNPHKKISHTLPLANLNLGANFIRFSPLEKNHLLHFQMNGRNVSAPLELNESDHIIDVNIQCEVILGTQSFSLGQSFSVAKGTTAALCSHFGGASSKMTSHYYDQFSNEKEELKRLPALLAYVGASYFEKCSRIEKTLADLHKINPFSVFAFGLAKLSPDLSKGIYKNEEDLKLPQVDMFSFNTMLPTTAQGAIWNQEFYTAKMQCESLVSVDSSSNEHQIIREVFKDPYAISTVKLLQLAHQEHQKKGLDGIGFLSFTKESFDAVDKTPESAICFYFPHLENVNPKNINTASLEQWNFLKRLLDESNPLSAWTIAYMTPGITQNLDGTYKETGSLILCPFVQFALISSNNLVSHGGLGSPIPSNYLTTNSINERLLVLNLGSNSYSLDIPGSPTTSSATNSLTNSSTYKPLEAIQPFQEKKEWTSDVRSEHKSSWSFVSDPVDVVSGAFYIDEVDLALPGPLSLSIRRNYNNQNPLTSDLGCGWKLSLNPFLIDQEEIRFAAELDGTVIAYSYNPQKDRWEVIPENNLELYNFSQQGIGSTSNFFNSYIENDVLYGADGSKRFYEDGLLQKWEDAIGNTLSFIYHLKRLSRIESSNGDFIGIYYNHEGKISEIYARDGRRISYDYDYQGDLIRVTLPNTAEILYEYDRYHQIIRETKPYGKVLENIYDDEGRVTEQRSQVGLKLEMVTTATFKYSDGQTIVKDAAGAETIYQIFGKQIYKITDPLGLTTFQSWFIDENSWFDPENGIVTPWNQNGGATRSLKSTTDKRGLTTSYSYDKRGNLEMLTLSGDDLTGSHTTNIFKKFAYNERNLCIEEEAYEQNTLTTYDLKFPYLPKRIEKFSEDILISYIEFFYNELGRLEKQDASGAITLWKYNGQGFPCEKTQVTGTEDPDVTTSFTYNPQGQCIKITFPDGIQENKYDLMGNVIETKMLSLSQELLSATYIGYDLNNAPIWKHTANSENVVYLDYQSSGLVKAKRQTLSNRSMAYTLYEYDPCGYLIEETDPRGYVTYRDYDLLGRVKAETKEGLTTQFSYESGGQLHTVTSPSGATILRHYTTNGLLKEEIYPDGTKALMTYDVFGRPILEIKNGIAFEIKYDDAHHLVIKTHVTSQQSEISEFDQRGNLIKFIDKAGYITEKTYDGLNRLKSETTPSGKKTNFSYKDNLNICTLACGETITTEYAAGQAIKSEVFNSNGILVSSSSVHFDPKNDIQEIIKGDEKTTTWTNTLGLPLKVQKGSNIAEYQYDTCGNCILISDGDGKITKLEYDGFNRISKKQLPGGSIVKFVYDQDSNLSEYHLPNGNTWKASYDCMQRKTSEELFSSNGSTGHFEFAYENGYLKKTIDPMERSHSYIYDSLGRLQEHSIEGSKRTYTYDTRGLLSSVAQKTHLNSRECPRYENSLVERAYDVDGNLSLESIYLNSTLIQQTEQTWTANSRTLKSGNHIRDYHYQNSRLAEVTTQHGTMAYTYNLNGALKSKNNSLLSTTIDYNTSGLPKTIVTKTPHASSQEQLEWYSSGKLSTYKTCKKEHNFSYDNHGHLKSASSEKYDFDFNSKGNGVLTEAPGWYVPEDGLDEFGKVLTTVFEKMSSYIEYNAMGEIITQGQKKLSWNDWGRLVSVQDPGYSWEASYDAFGRRLQTRYTKNGEKPIITNSFYDPQEEFQEIGVQIEGKTFWKFYGPNACDMVSDETGAYVSLNHNALRQLTGVISKEETTYSEKLPSAYGVIDSEFSVPSDLNSFAKSLYWHSKAQDPTGYIWMGDRYYDPTMGSFLSQDAVSYPITLNLYTYADGDPINYFDPDGRFASYAYEAIKPVVIGAFRTIMQPLRFLKNVCNLTVDVLINHNWSNTEAFQVGSNDSPCVSIDFVNGIDNTKMQAQSSAEYISQLAQGAKINVIYNATNLKGLQPLSIVADVFECIISRFGICTPPVKKLMNEWNDFHATNPPDAKKFIDCHSGGASHVKNALLRSPKEVQQRIIALAIAPSEIIPEKLCFKSYNYISKRDFVTHLDIWGKVAYGNQLKILEPHPNANFWDHEFSSPTFENVLKLHITEYLRDYGSK